MRKQKSLIIVAILILSTLGLAIQPAAAKLPFVTVTEGGIGVDEAGAIASARAKIMAQAVLSTNFLVLSTQEVTKELPGPFGSTVTVTYWTALVQASIVPLS